MPLPLCPEEIAAAFIVACEAELHALKPGNVHVHAGGHHMEVWHFEAAARAAAPHIANPSLGVGARIEAAVKASLAVANCNTNLGILLLTAPLAKAAQAEGGPQDLRARLEALLPTLDESDAEHVFRAIAAANPAGLGRVEQGDVTGPARMTLFRAMEIAGPRDRIAKAYVTGFSAIFELGLAALAEARRNGATETWAISQLHMQLLARWPDTHIARKHGLEVAEGVRREAEATLNAVEKVAENAARAALLAFDQSLKSRKLNPGTTADFVVATLFTHEILARSAAPTPV